MHENNINIIREEAERLLRLQIKLLGEMQEAPHVLSDPSGTGGRTFDLQSVPKKIAMLEDEARKLSSMELVLAVVGTMKAGKSTTINAIVGAEVLPNRNRPMTTLPTLIRHTPGVRQPRLIFRNTKPVNQLMEKLREVIATPVSPGNVANDPDMHELLGRINREEPFTDQHDGADAIFAFLKELNDLVRLSKSLGTHFPFADYSRIDDLPAIEVEFTHLRELDHVQGRLTLLDTPGPDEAGQAAHLLPMLQDQLENASAVLIVLDYTKLNSDAEAKVRAEIGNIVRTTGDRLYALVNKFDQKDRNGDDAEKVRKYVAVQLMDGVIPQDRVYPVSSKLGFLASRAKNEIALHGRLPDAATNSWVEDFAEPAFGRHWESKMEDRAALAGEAEYLWKKSLFSEPLAQVIGKTYDKAAIESLSSAVDKMAEVAEGGHGFLKAKSVGLNQGIKLLRKHIEELQKHIDAVQNLEKEVAADMGAALEKVTQGIAAIGTKAQEDALSILGAYFKEGKRIERAQHDEESNGESGKPEKAKVTNGRDAPREERLGDALMTFLSSLGRGSSIPQGHDFDPRSPIIKFEGSNGRIKAKDILKKMEGSIAEVLNASEVNLQEGVQSRIAEFDEQFRGHIAKARELIKEVEKGMHDFNLTIRLPDVHSVSFDLDMSDVLDDAMREKTESQTRRRRQSGIWGTACGWFKTDDWGWERYSQDVQFYEINIAEIKGSVERNIDVAFKGIRERTIAKIENQLTEQADAFFDTLQEKAENILGGLMGSLNDSQKDEQEKKDIAHQLRRLERPVADLLKDSVGLKEQVAAIKEPAEQARKATAV